MIKVNELRIGNLLQDTDAKFISIDGQHLYWFDMGLNEELQTRLTPIPLTPEILERCDATKLEDSEWKYLIHISALKMYFRFNAGKCYSNIGGIYMGDQIGHLHELQNLKHSLSGQELQYTP